MSDAVPHSRSSSILKGREWFLPVVFAGLIVVTYLVGVVLGTLTRGEPTLLPFVSEPILYPGLFVVAPPALAAGNTLHSGSIPSSLAIGLVPGFTFPLLGLLATLFGIGDGDAPGWTLSLVFGAIGLVGALVGVGIAIGIAYATPTLFK